MIAPGMARAGTYQPTTAMTITVPRVMAVRMTTSVIVMRPVCAGPAVGWSYMPCSLSALAV